MRPYIHALVDFDREMCETVDDSDMLIVELDADLIRQTLYAMDAAHELQRLRVRRLYGITMAMPDHAVVRPSAEFFTTHQDLLEEGGPLPVHQALSSHFESFGRMGDGAHWNVSPDVTYARSNRDESAGFSQGDLLRLLCYLVPDEEIPAIAEQMATGPGAGQLLEMVEHGRIELGAETQPMPELSRAAIHSLLTHEDDVVRQRAIALLRPMSQQRATPPVRR